MLLNLLRMLNSKLVKALCSQRPRGTRFSKAFCIEFQQLGMHL
jgi:exoribonuclease R